VSRIARCSVLLLAVISLGACYQDPEEQMAQQQLMQDMSDVVNQMGLQVAEMQGTLDSLKALVAKQDTAIYRMANVTGVPYVR
jgi:cytochrome c556